MKEQSQWDKLRKVINGVRTGHVMTDEAIIEISDILGVVPTVGNPFGLDKPAKADIPLDSDGTYTEDDQGNWSKVVKSDIPLSSDEMYLADCEGYSGNAPTGGSVDELDMMDVILEANKKHELVRTVDADKMAYMWTKYVNWKKFWFPHEPPFMEDFARYMRNFHQYDILDRS